MTRRRVCERCHARPAMPRWLICIVCWRHVNGGVNAEPVPGEQLSFHIGKAVRK